MEFDGIGFPLNPSLQPLATAEQSTGTRVLDFTDY